MSITEARCCDLELLCHRKYSDNEFAFQTVLKMGPVFVSKACISEGAIKEDCVQRLHTIGLFYILCSFQEGILYHCQCLFVCLFLDIAAVLFSQTHILEDDHLNS